MDNQTQGIFIPYTYTYDQFTVFFYGDRVFLGEKSSLPDSAVWIF
mgnify:FL=1